MMFETAIILCRAKIDYVFSIGQKFSKLKKLWTYCKPGGISETSSIKDFFIKLLFFLQRELLLAVELNNGKQFIVLGGANNADLNFPIGPDRMFLLLIAAAKGNDEMINLML